MEKEEKIREETLRNLQRLEREVEEYFKELDNEKLKEDVNKEMNIFINNYYRETHGVLPSLYELTEAKTVIYQNLFAAREAARNEKYYHNGIHTPDIVTSFLRSPLSDGNSFLLAVGYTTEIASLVSTGGIGGIGSSGASHLSQQSVSGSLQNLLNKASEEIEDKLQEKAKDIVSRLPERSRKQIIWDKMNDKLTRIIETELQKQRKLEEKNKVAERGIDREF